MKTPNKSNFLKMTYFLVGAGLLASPYLMMKVRANETAAEKVQTKTDEAKKDVKKSARKAKRKMRNATGRGSVTKDIDDAAKDAGDQIEHDANKLKRKVD